MATVRPWSLRWFALPLVAVLACVLLPALCEVFEPSADLQKQREEFIASFQRNPLNVPPDDGMFLRLLVQTSNCKNGLEVGTSTGYSALHMGIAFERNGGKLTSVDIDAQAVKTARENLAKAKLDKIVTVVEGDALKVLPELKEEYDFVFIDAVKADTMKYFKAIQPKIKPQALVVVHNAVSSASAMKDYLEAIQADKNYDTVIVRTGTNRDGFCVSYRKR